jgi:hypothetical protein
MVGVRNLSRLGIASLLGLVVCGGTDVRAQPKPVADPTGASAARAIVFRFTPTERAQIAIWVEEANGTFLKTVALTQAVSVYGIGNRPGAAQMNSGYHWPYGRREGVLPIWAHRRANAPDVPGQFPRIIFQHRTSEGWASRSCEDSTLDTYFCLSFTAESTRKDELDATSCASRFNSDKGRILTPTDVAAGYWEPATVASQAIRRPLELFSLYPPRRDFTACDLAGGMPPCSGGSSGCKDHPDAPLLAVKARQAMPDIDVVTTATPPAGIEQALMFSIPDGWPPGSYVAWMEVNTEGDYNPTFNDDVLPTPQSPDWDSWAMGYGYPFRGQPSVVFRVPFTVGASDRFWTAQPEGFGSVDGTDSNAGEMHAMDGTITDDPIGASGSGADRLRLAGNASYRLEVEVRECEEHMPPGSPLELQAEPVTDPKHAHQWGHLNFLAPASERAVARYDVRYSTSPILQDDPESFIRGLPGLAATTEMEALMIPVGAAPGTIVSVDFGGLSPSTHYWVAVRAVDSCNRSGPHAVAELTTTKVDYTQLSGCFVATAAWGSALEPQVAALRGVRDRLEPANALFAVAADLYYRSSPAAAHALRRSDSARALVRHFLGPLGAAAEAGMAIVGN